MTDQKRIEGRKLAEAATGDIWESDEAGYVYADGNPRAIVDGYRASDAAEVIGRFIVEAERDAA